MRFICEFISLFRSYKRVFLDCVGLLRFSARAQFTEDNSWAVPNQWSFITSISQTFALLLLNAFQTHNSVHGYYLTTLLYCIEIFISSFICYLPLTSVLCQSKHHTVHDTQVLYTVNSMFPKKRICTVCLSVSPPKHNTDVWSKSGPWSQTQNNTWLSVKLFDGGFGLKLHLSSYSYSHFHHLNITIEVSAKHPLTMVLGLCQEERRSKQEWEWV